jgi:hypothetical protein
MYGGKELSIEQMRERPVAQVVHEPRDLDAQHLAKDNTQHAVWHTACHDPAHAA